MSGILNPISSCKVNFTSRILMKIDNDLIRIFFFDMPSSDRQAILSHEFQIRSIEPLLRGMPVGVRISRGREGHVGDD